MLASAVLVSPFSFLRKRLGDLIFIRRDGGSSCGNSANSLVEGGQLLWSLLEEEIECCAEHIFLLVLLYVYKGCALCAISRTVWKKACL